MFDCQNPISLVGELDMSWKKDFDEYDGSYGYLPFLSEPSAQMLETRLGCCGMMSTLTA